MVAGLRGTRRCNRERPANGADLLRRAAFLSNKRGGGATLRPPPHYGRELPMRILTVVRARLVCPVVSTPWIAKSGRARAGHRIRSQLGAGRIVHSGSVPACVALSHRNSLIRCSETGSGIRSIRFPIIILAV